MTFDRHPLIDLSSYLPGTVHSHMVWAKAEFVYKIPPIVYFLTTEFHIKLSIQRSTIKESFFINDMKALPVASGEVLAILKTAK